MDDARCLVQFMHPGREHQPDTATSKRWNSTRSAHARKFVRAPGRLMTPAGTSADDLVFWTEWEPESQVDSRIPRPMPDGPHYIYSPTYSVPNDYSGLQNTDPNVFDGFHYTLCRQYKSGRPTQLRNLSRGSVILFGSHLHGCFVLDTVFVVRDWREHNAVNYRSVVGGIVPDAYLPVTLEPCYQSGQAPDGQVTSYRLYLGATVDDPVDDMFSYFPCKRYEPATNGFPRPVVDLSSVVSPGMKMGFRLNKLPRESIQGHWSAVLKIVRAAGLSAGTWAAMPPRS